MLAIKIVAAVIFLVVGYLLGSINAAVIVSKTLYKSDIRDYGSGNAGTTNMLRTFGKKAAGLTFLVDLLKGIAACALATLFAMLFKGGDNVLRELCVTAAGAGAVLGHNWPVYFGFKGGKGVLTSFAIMLFIVPVPALIALAVFILVVALSRYVSLGSILAAITLPVTVFFLGDYLAKSVGSGISVTFLFCVFVAALLIIRHHANIGRLIKGTESKVFSKKKADKI